MNIKITLDENDVKKIVTDHLKTKFKNVGKVDIEVTTKRECVDLYRNEYQTYGQFRRINCEVEM